MDNMIYVVNREGQEVRRFRQPSIGTYGFHDLAYDGQYLYGGEDTLVFVFDLNGNSIRAIRVPVSENELLDPIALAYDPRAGTLYMANGESNIFEMTTNGELLQSFRAMLPGEIFNIQGLAWNPVDDEGYNLYAMDWRDNIDGQRMRLVKIDPTTGRAG